MKKLNLFLVFLSAQVLFYFLAHAEYLQGKVGSIQINAPPGFYKVGVNFMYIKMDGNKTNGCYRFSNGLSVKGSMQSIYVPAAADGSIVLPRSIGGHPSLHEFECWNAMISVQYSVFPHVWFMEEIQDSPLSSEALYSVNHPMSSYGNREASSLSMVKEFLDSKTRVLILPEIKVNLTKAQKTPGENRREYILFARTSANSSKEQTYFQSHQVDLPEGTFQTSISGPRRFQVLREPPSEFVLSVYSVVRDYNKYHELKKKCYLSEKKSFDPTKLPEAVVFNASLDCEPQ